jgi:hypothetical protein
MGLKEMELDGIEEDWKGLDWMDILAKREFVS